MSEQTSPTTALKVYESKVLLNWDTPENRKTMIFPKDNCACKRCPFMDWQVLEVEIEGEENQEKSEIPVTMYEFTNYCHDRYCATWGRGLPNIPDCDGLYKQPKE
ncbi:hypothetical protein LP085_07960 [Achromobacter sp. MY14]|uniref:hypothetical protein n=1 Tax=unclassified Achromobacter TaxID=2626865 RepID=UPI001E5A1BDE|nr:hypothetical protein [Achromobacter sp. MY14]MCD0496782.1 hypothetical protein [Achromobacter sp. MY14]